MSSRLVLAAAPVMLAVTAGALPAQRPTNGDVRLRSLLARAETLAAEARVADSVRRIETSASRRGQVVRAGRLVLVFWGTVTPESARRVAVRADSMLESFDAAFGGLLDSVVGVQHGVSDLDRVLGQPLLRSRAPVELDVQVRPADSLNDATTVVLDVSRRFRDRLDKAWRAWLPWDMGVVWRATPNGLWALQSLTQPQWSTGAGCLAGRLSECRLWLGLDPTERPLATRYRTSDLRKMVRAWGGSGDRRHADCLGSDDAACLQLVESSGSFRYVDSVPAGAFARAGVVRAIWALHGPATLDRALRDTVGGVGERFARAAGVSEDSLVAEARLWMLSGGRTDHLAASLPQSLIILFAALAVVFLAARSGRWR